MARLTPGPDGRGELLSAYLDGELSRDEDAAVRDLVERDDAAAAELRLLRQVRSRLRLIPDIEIPAQLLPGGHPGDRLSAYLDGELATIEQHRVSRHLADCPECRAELHELDRARIAVRSLPGVGGDVTAELPATAVSRRRRVGMIAGAIGATAAAAVLVLGLVSGGRERPIVTLDDLAVRHVARASAEPAFSIMPAVVEVSAP